MESKVVVGEQIGGLREGWGGSNAGIEGGCATYIGILER